ncbi:ATP-dependent DNA helicase [Candidatus Woesearchaeota archaeon]|nr:ATP-dependent DNA helicase [Candidatus Woesearchaeota archaeon]
MVSPFVENYFPHSTIREGQKELVDDIENAIKTQTPLIAHAPTGLGKTASALSVAIAYALKNKKRVFFATNRHTQHAIALDTVRKIGQKIGQPIICADLMGKKNMCSQEVADLFQSDFSEYCRSIVERGECSYYNKVKEKQALSVEAKHLVSTLKHVAPSSSESILKAAANHEMCGYEISIALGKDAQVIIGDYNYLFNSFIQSSLFGKIGLTLEDTIIIVDEGHNIPSRVMDMMSSSLSITQLKYAIQESQKFGFRGLVSWISEIERIINSLAAFENDQKEKKVNKQDLLTPLTKLIDYDSLLEQLETAADEVRKKQRKSFLGGIVQFLQSWSGSEEGYARVLIEKSGFNGSVLTLQYLCLDPSIVTKDIFDQAYATVIMSGTLKPLFMYKDLLGIPKAAVKEYASPFPADNKLSIIIPQTSTKYSLRSEAMFTSIGQICATISKQIPGNVALFFPSYDLRDRIATHIHTSKRLLYEKPTMSKEEKEQFLATFHSLRREGAVLLGVAGANFAEGVDFPGDLLNGVVVVGIPLSRPDIRTQELITYYDRKFGKGFDYGYVYPAINKCLQSAGRCIRSETDRGVVIYLDERFAHQQYFSCFPRERLLVTKDFEKHLSLFFASK